MFASYPAFSDHASDVVFFVVNKIEVFPLHHGTESEAITASGALGCWVDSTVTKVIQTGVQHSRVPDLAGYLGIGQSSYSSLSTGFDITKIVDTLVAWTRLPPF